MRTFSDETGRSWSLGLSINTVKRVRDRLAVDLLDLFAGDPPLLTRLTTDVVLLCDVVFALVEDQAKEANVTSEQFGASLGGEAIVRMHDAFMEELRDFFRGLRRLETVRAVEKQIELIQKISETAAEKVSQIDLTAATAQMQSLDLNQRIAETLGKSSGS